MLSVRVWMKLLVVTSLFCAGNIYADNQGVIAHRGFETEEMTRSMVRAIFSMRLRRVGNGTQITVFVLPDAHPVHRLFTRKTLSLFPHQLRRSWDRYVYSGIGIAPIEVKTEDEMIDRVAITPGSIGYISREVLNENVRTISVR
ncbi:MAG: hypothetical protein V7745_01500 [Pseudomonadales bacterium]